MLKFTSPKEVYDALSTHLKTLLTSRNKTDITRAFKVVICIVGGECMDDMNKKWTDKEAYPAFEWSRCLVSTRTMQLIKENHCQTPRWTYVKALYANLYSKLYADIDPETEVMHSSGSIEDLPCKYSLSSNIIKDTLNLLDMEKKERLKMKFTKLCKETKEQMYCDLAYKSK